MDSSQCVTNSVTVVHVSNILLITCTTVTHTHVRTSHTLYISIYLFSADSAPTSAVLPGALRALMSIALAEAAWAKVASWPSSINMAAMATNRIAERMVYVE